MSKGLVKCVVLGVVCSVAVGTAGAGYTIAGTTKAQELVPIVAAAKPAKQQFEQRYNQSIQRTSKSPIRPAVKRRSGVNMNRVKPVTAKLKRKSLKSPPRKQSHNETESEAVPQSKADLMYHGMLESQQRYDPRRDHLGSGIPDPQTPELTHDHFQELDRNQDGKVDPVERAFGRPDMDRDLHSHGSR